MQGKTTMEGFALEEPRSKEYAYTHILDRATSRGTGATPFCFLHGPMHWPLG